ncbi:uL15 family ribosomal protein [Candidatus Woesearchaeota archaeon]|nr:uL15 family ribosomal protein [Candidatus Woesearchaeota archaeon]
MTHNKRKKNSRQRGEWTHGWGAKKKHRGAGHRGGRGNAGSGKRGDAKKPSYWKDEKYFGKNGFVSINKIEIKAIGISHLDSIIDTLIKTGKATINQDTISINLKDIKYQKLLGTGNTQRKLEITTEMASPKAIEKIQKAGGNINLPKQE